MGQRSSAYGSIINLRKSRKESSAVTFDSRLSSELSKVSLSKNRPVAIEELFKADGSARRDSFRQQDPSDSRSIEVNRWKTSNALAQKPDDVSIDTSYIPTQLVGAKYGSANVSSTLNKKNRAH